MKLGKPIRHWPVKSVQEMFLRNVEMEICVCWGREGVTTAALLTEKVSESLWREELRGVKYRVLHQVSQTCTRNTLSLVLKVDMTDYSPRRCGGSRKFPTSISREQALVLALLSSTSRTCTPRSRSLFISSSSRSSSLEPQRTNRGGRWPLWLLFMILVPLNTEIFLLHSPGSTFQI